MLSYTADFEAGVTPNLMTRFREEVYASKAYKAARKKEQAIRGFPERAKAAPRPEVRAEYFRKPRLGHRAPTPAWRRLDA